MTKRDILSLYLCGFISGIAVAILIASAGSIWHWLGTIIPTP